MNVNLPDQTNLAERLAGLPSSLRGEIAARALLRRLRQAAIRWGTGELPTSRELGLLLSVLYAVLVVVLSARRHGTPTREIAHVASHLANLAAHEAKDYIAKARIHDEALAASLDEHNARLAIRVADLATHMSLLNVSDTEAAVLEALAEADEAARAEIERDIIASVNCSLFETPLWSDRSRQFPLSGTLFGTPEFRFWQRMYRGFRSGEPLPWELFDQVVEIDEGIWRQGPTAVAQAIAQIESEWDAGRRAEAGSIPSEEVRSVSERVTANRDAIAVSAAGILEQLAAFRERVRGMNALDPDVRDEILEFLDAFSSQLSALLHDLPLPRSEIDEVQGSRLAAWLRGYRVVLLKKLGYYSSPENVGEATIPTAIILSATGVGAMMGAPLAGAAVGGLITNQMKADKAAGELLKANTSDAD